MTHPLEITIRNAQPFLLIGDSSEGRFPAMSFHSYTRMGQRFYCLDLGGRVVSRGLTSGHRVYTSVMELPEDRSDLAIIWVRPRTAARAVEVAHDAGCKRIWLSFGTAHPDAVRRARELGMEIVEIGRCPVCYMDEMVPACVVHTRLMKLTGAYDKPPQTSLEGRRREMI